MTGHTPVSMRLRGLAIFGSEILPDPSAPCYPIACLKGQVIQEGKGFSYSRTEAAPKLLYFFVGEFLFIHINASVYKWYDI